MDGGSGCNGAISGSNKFKMAAAAILKKNSNGHISATGRPIHFMFGYMVGFSGTVDLMALFLIRTNSMAAAAILDNFEWPYLRNGSRSTYIARIARSSLRQHSFLVV